MRKVLLNILANVRTPLFSESLQDLVDLIKLIKESFIIETIIVIWSICSAQLRYQSNREQCHKTRDGSVDGSAVQLSSEGQGGRDCSHGDEWIEKHSGSSTFVRELLKKFQPNNSQGKAMQKIRPKSAFLPPSHDHKNPGDKNFGSLQNKNHADSESACKMTSSLKHRVVARDEVFGSSTYETSNANGSSGHGRRVAPVASSSPREIESSKSAGSPSPELTEVSVSKLSSIFETSASSRKPFAKLGHVGAKANTDNGCVDYLSVLKPCGTSEWNKSLLSDKSSSVSVSCLVRSDDLVDTRSLIRRTRPSSLYDRGRANDEGSYKTISDDAGSRQSDFRASGLMSSPSSMRSSPSSMRSSPVPPQSKRLADDLLDAECLRGQESNLPRLKSILKSNCKQQQLVGQVGGNREIIFSGRKDEASDEVPFFRRILKSSEHSDSILYGGRPTLDSKTMSADPHEYAGVGNEPAIQCAVQRRLSRHDSDSIADGTELPKYELQDQTSHKSSKTDFKNECVDYLSVLKKHRKDSSSKNVDITSTSNETDSNSQELPFYKLKLRKTDHSALLIEADNCNTNINIIKGNNQDNVSPEFVPGQESAINFKSKVFMGNISSTSSPLSSSSSSSSPLFKSHREQIETETNSNSQESLQSSNSELCFVDSEPRVVLRKLSTDSHLGSSKRRAIIRLSAERSLPAGFVDRYDNDLANVLPGGTSDDEEPLNQTKPQKQDNKEQVQSKLEMTLKELHQSEINYIDKLELIEYFKSELMNMKAITEQEAWTMFVNTSDILKFHKERMLPELEKCVASEECLLGEVFDRLAPKLIIYSDCLAGFSEAMRAISQKEKKNVNFQKCLHEIQSNPKCAQLTLQNHMLNLVQRIPKYLLFMKQYLKYLPQDSPDFFGTKNGLQSLMNVANSNNRSIKRNEKKSFIARGEKLELLCIVCGKDVTNKHVRCTHCQKFYCKPCFSNQQSSSMKLKFCTSCLVESRKSIYKLQAESLKLKDGELMVKKPRDNWVKQWFVIDSSGKFYSISSATNDFDKVDVIPLENAKLRVPSKHSNTFILQLKDNKSRYFRTSSKEEFDEWIEGFKSVLSEKQFIMFPTYSLAENMGTSTLESET